MRGHNVHEVFYQNCENHDPWVNGSDPLGRDQYGQKMYKIL